MSVASILAGSNARECRPMRAGALECVRMLFFCCGVDVALM